MKPNIARIQVEHPFCTKCGSAIKETIVDRVKNLRNVVLYPAASLVVFKFNQVNQVSEVLNTLMGIGHPQRGDLIQEGCSVPPLCTCGEIQKEEHPALESIII